MRTILLMLLVSTSCLSQLRVSANGHYLYDKQTGKPVFLNGQSVWCLFTATTYSQADSFFQNCQTYGINFLLCNLISDGMSTGEPANRNGDTPFTGTAFQSTPRESYFTHCDSVIGRAKHYGIYLQAYISYLGNSAAEGWQTEIGAASIAQMKTWGDFVGARYKDSTNLMWGISGDCNPTTWRQKLDSMSAALMLQDTNHLLIPRDDYPSTTQTYWSGRSWLKVEYIYQYWGPVAYNPNLLYSTLWSIYNSNRPGYMNEAWYEGEHQYPTGSYPTDEEVRRQMYYGSPIAGSMGHVFGNCPVWHFSRGFNAVCNSNDYRTWLGSQAHISAKWVGKLFRNRRWWTFVPDQSAAVLTAGAGTGDTRAICAYASDSSTIMVHAPVSTTLTVTSARLKGDSTYAWWFNPSNGTTTFIGSQTRSSHTYATGGENILVLDAKVMGFPAPGLDTTVTATQNYILLGN